MEQVPQGDAQRTHGPRIAASWALVSIPLAYGLYNAIEAATQLFTG